MIISPLPARPSSITANAISRNAVKLVIATPSVDKSKLFVRGFANMSSASKVDLPGESVGNDKLMGGFDDYSSNQD